MSEWLATCSSLKPGFGDPGSSLGWVRQFLLGLLPLTQVYEMGSNPAMDEHPIHGGVKISLQCYLWKSVIRATLICLLGLQSE